MAMDIMKMDQEVFDGQIIAEYGNTETCSKGARLHFEIQKFNRKNYQYVNLNPTYIFKWVSFTY